VCVRACVCIYIYIMYQFATQFTCFTSAKVQILTQLRRCVRQWESEKKRIGLEKLCRAFIDDIAVEHVSFHFCVCVCVCARARREHGCCC
jgi:phage-related baseplate assembly protein